MLMTDPKFNQQYMKNVPVEMRDDIKDKVETLQTKVIHETVMRMNGP